MADDEIPLLPPAVNLSMLDPRRDAARMDAAVSSITREALARRAARRRPAVLGELAGMLRPVFAAAAVIALIAVPTLLRARSAAPPAPPGSAISELAAREGYRPAATEVLAAFADPRWAPGHAGPAEGEE
ncbi:MAG: hypothetical protein ACM3OH_10940 [Bacillota bacterium]